MSLTVKKDSKMDSLSVLSPRSSGEFIASHAKHIQIHDAGIDKCCHLLTQRLKDGTFSSKKLFAKTEVHPQEANEKGIDWVFFADALNFSFWTQDHELQYLVTYKNKTYTGYLSMCAAINRTLDQGVPLTTPSFFESITKEELNQYLMGDNNVPVPLLDQRLQCLREVGASLRENYSGSFVNCIKKCDGSAQRLLELVVTEFPCFRDEATFDGRRVAIYKRAQILISDIWCLFEGKGLGTFGDIDSLTMFADYRVPQSLQFLGVFEYSDALLSKLRSNEELPNGSEFEVEIRGCSIDAVQRIVRKMNASNLPEKVNDILLDYFLWGYRRELADEMEKFPYHKTRSVYY